MDDLTIQLNKILGDYEKSVDEKTKKVFQKVAGECVKQLKSTSPRREKGARAGQYASGWASKKNGNQIVVHNKTDYQLTHLLENGHALRQGGRAGAIVHIKPVEEWAQNETVEQVERELQS